jgi:hypothetical protein
MSLIFTKESENCFVICIKGALTFNDLKEAEKRGREEIDRSQKVKLLVIAEQFSGWGKDGDWGDLTFMHEYDPYIEKIAVVADEKWRDQLLMFLGAGRRKAPVTFFFPDEEKDARDWLQSESQ